MSIQSIIVWALVQLHEYPTLLLDGLDVACLISCGARSFAGSERRGIQEDCAVSHSPGEGRRRGVRLTST